MRGFANTDCRYLSIAQHCIVTSNWTKNGKIVQYIRQNCSIVVVYIINNKKIIYLKKTPIFIYWGDKFGFTKLHFFLIFPICPTTIVVQKPKRSLAKVHRITQANSLPHGMRYESILFSSFYPPQRLVIVSFAYRLRPNFS